MVPGMHEIERGLDFVHQVDLVAFHAVIASELEIRCRL